MDEATQGILTEFIAAYDAGQQPDPEEYAQRCGDPGSRDSFRQVVQEFPDLGNARERRSTLTY